MTFGRGLENWKRAGRNFLESAGGWSLRFRLSIFFTLFLLAAWLLAAVFSWRENREYIDEFFDTQQTVFAKTLLTADVNSLRPRLPKTKDVLKGVDKEARGSQDKNALGFAVFDAAGGLLLDDGEKGKHFEYDGWTRGFVDRPLEKGKQPWRLVWLISPDGDRIVAVGQELQYRDRMTMHMLKKQLTPWLLLLPVLLGGLFWMLSRELSPIREVAGKLEARSARDTGPLEIRRIPSEIRPLLQALNALFARVAAMLARERTFVADAAHELRTPLAGLRVQTEVIALSGGDPGERERAVENMLVSIDRCARLMEQLLTLSRLERLPDAGFAAGEGEPPGYGMPDWPLLLEEAVDACRSKAAGKNISLQCTIRAFPEDAAGHTLLIGLLLRNLVDNAVRYSPENGSVRVILDRHALTMENSGPGVAPEHLSRLGERFFRPPGQEETGSGLGLSIAHRIAGLHDFRLELYNKASSDGGHPDGFVASIVFPASRGKQGRANK